MRVQIDEPRCHDAAAQVEYRAFRGGRFAVDHVSDALGVEHERDVGPDRSCFDVGQPATSSSHEGVTRNETLR